MIDTKTNNAKKSIKILCITAVLVLIAAGIAGSYWFCPVIYASFRSLFWPEKVYWIETLCGGKKYLLPLYYKCEGHQSFRTNKKLPVLVLCNLPLPSDSYQHLKIFPNGIGIFQTPAEWFVVRKNYLHLKSGSCLTRPVEDDMKGWETAYSITREKGKIFYKIAPSHSKGRKRPSIEFAVPEALFKNVPDLPCDYREEKRDKNKLYVLPYTKPDADISEL